MLVTLPAPDLPAGPRSALIIATSTYADTRLRALRTPAHDASGLAAVLADPFLGGFAVTQLKDEGVQDVRLAIDEFLAARITDETVVVYLSCHGLLTARRRLYFAASDTKKDRLASTGVEARWLIDCLDECRARRQVIILDCCFSGAFALSKGTEDVELQERFGDPAELGRGRVVLTASRATEYSFEGKRLTPGSPAGSVFTEALVDGLRTGEADQNRDGLVSVSDAYEYAHARVRAVGTAQTPQRWIFGGEGREIVLTRSPAGLTIQLAELPDELRAGLQSRHPHMRIGAINALAEWLTDPDPARAIAARQVIEEVAAEDIPLVAKTARAQLSKVKPRLDDPPLRDPAPDRRNSAVRPASNAVSTSARQQAARKGDVALRYAVRSDVGLIRATNGDSAYAGPRLLAVADGITDDDAAEVASAMAIKAMTVLDDEPVANTELIDGLASAFTGAKQGFRDVANSDPAMSNIRAALTVFLWSGLEVAICHIGNSRAYLLRKGDLYQVTHDHTFAQELIDKGQITDEETATHQDRAKLLRVLDGRADADPDLFLLRAERGDRFLLCTDGLLATTSAEAIHEVLDRVTDREEAALGLIRLAINGGGHDNITCIVADVIDAGRGEPVTPPGLVGAAAWHDQR